MAKIDFHDVISVKAISANQYKRPSGHWWAITLQLADAKESYNQVTIYTEKAEVIEHIDNLKLVIDEVA
tara:strand:+ start:234 stop:440 length:207 start_codon:yes stop_codon:yes gene_type:complete